MGQAGLQDNVETEIREIETRSTIRLVAMLWGLREQRIYLLLSYPKHTNLHFFGHKNQHLALYFKTIQAIFLVL